MKTERSNIKFPLWRKKVDHSLLENEVTPIPNFLHEQWKINKLFGECYSKSDNASKITVVFKGKRSNGSICFTKSKSRSLCRFHFEPELADQLKSVYVMSYMRSIEDRLRQIKKEYKGQNIEEEIPFWEFLDLEFDSKTKTMYLNAHYVQKPLYLELFKEIVNSHVLFNIENTINNKEEFSIVKSEWKCKDDLDSQIDAKNVIYNLIDMDNKQIYIGEAESLLTRLRGKRTEIPNWTHYRFDSLPNGLSKQQRVAIERMLIRVFASFFENSKISKSMEVSAFKLMNKKIDS